jgi:hypothetical protein
MRGSVLPRLITFHGLIHEHRNNFTAINVPFGYRVIGTLACEPGRSVAMDTTPGTRSLENVDLSAAVSRPYGGLPN